MQTFKTPEGNEISSIEMELMRAEILIHTMERVEDETLFKLYDIFKSIEQSKQ